MQHYEVLHVIGADDHPGEMVLEMTSTQLINVRPQPAELDTITFYDALLLALVEVEA